MELIASTAKQIGQRCAGFLDLQVNTEPGTGVATLVRPSVGEGLRVSEGFTDRKYPTTVKPSLRRVKIWPSTHNSARAGPLDAEVHMRSHYKLASLTSELLTTAKLLPPEDFWRLAAVVSRNLTNGEAAPETRAEDELPELESAR